MVRYIKNAEDAAPSAEDRLNDILSVLKDNFEFAVDGIDKIAADGDVSGAIQLATDLNDTIDSMISEIAGDIAQ